MRRRGHRGKNEKENPGNAEAEQTKEAKPKTRNKRREESQTKAESQRMTRKEIPEQGSKHKTPEKLKHDEELTAKKPENKMKKREILPWRRKIQTSEYPPSESQKTNIGDPTLSGTQNKMPEHTNRIEQTKAKWQTLKREATL